MELTVRVCWLLLAAVHLLPALVGFSPGLGAKLYGLTATGDLAVVLTHRGLLFLAVLLACLGAAVDPASRRLASVVVTVSVVGFLVTWARGATRGGPLKRVALVDLLALPPLGIAVFAAWS